MSKRTPNRALFSSIRAVFVLLLVLALAACGGTSTGPGEGSDPDPDPDTDALTQEEAQAFANAATASNAYVLAPFLDPTSFNPLSSSAPVASLLPQGFVGPKQDECSSISGDLTDTDNDGIPVNYKEVLNCNISSDGIVFIASGSLTVQDKNDADPRSGYSVVFDDYSYRVTANGETIAIEFDMTFDLTISSTSYRADYDYDLSISGTDDPGHITFDYTVTYTPDSLTDPFAAGTFVFNGSLNYRSGTEVYAMQTSSTGLHYSEICGDFDSGSARYQDDAGNTIVITYNSCGNVTVTYNGTRL